MHRPAGFGRSLLDYDALRKSKKGIEISEDLNFGNVFMVSEGGLLLLLLFSIRLLLLLPSAVSFSLFSSPFLLFSFSFPFLCLPSYFFLFPSLPSFFCFFFLFSSPSPRLFILFFLFFLFFFSPSFYFLLLFHFLFYSGVWKPKSF